MAEYRADDQFMVIMATRSTGEDVAIHIRHSVEQIIASGFNMPYVKKSTTEIVDITGSKDGSGSIVETKTNQKLNPSLVEKFRVLETPSELSAIFKEANLPVPPVKKSWGCIARNIGHALGMK